MAKSSRNILEINIRRVVSSMAKQKQGGICTYKFPCHRGKEAKRLTGNTMCFWGNVPARMLITGVPEQVRDDVKELIDTFADTGGLIVDSSMGLPDEARPENVDAMIETVFTYGVN